MHLGSIIGNHRKVAVAESFIMIWCSLADNLKRMKKTIDVIRLFQGYVLGNDMPINPNHQLGIERPPPTRRKI